MAKPTARAKSRRRKPTDGDGRGSPIAPDLSAKTWRFQSPRRSNKDRSEIELRSKRQRCGHHGACALMPCPKAPLGRRCGHLGSIASHSGRGCGYLRGRYMLVTANWAAAGARCRVLGRAQVPATRGLPLPDLPCRSFVAGSRHSALRHKSELKNYRNSGSLTAFTQSPALQGSQPGSHERANLYFYHETSDLDSSIR